MSDKVLAWLASSVVLSALIAAFVTIGSPGLQREIRFDQQRVYDMQNIQHQVVQYWNQKDVLPPDLDALSSSITGYQAPKDPQTGADYEYKVLSELSFELCAEFNRPSREERARAVPYPVYDPAGQNWSHEGGRTCFARTIDPQRDRMVLPAKF